MGYVGLYLRLYPALRSIWLAEADFDYMEIKDAVTVVFHASVDELIHGHLHREWAPDVSSAAAAQIGPKVKSYFHVSQIYWYLFIPNATSGVTLYFYVTADLVFICWYRDGILKKVS